MSYLVEIFGAKMEYDFLSGWIKYMRIDKGYSQEALAYGVCSPSHLSYFEHGKKKLRAEILEALLEKLGICKIEEPESLGLIRKKFYDMMQHIEFYNVDEAKVIYNELLAFEELLELSPYNIEFKIYRLLYNSYFGGLPLESLKGEILALDKIYDALTDELKHIFLIGSGKAYLECSDHIEGLKRFERSFAIKETAWVNYVLGRYFCFHDQHSKGIHYLEKALSSYEYSGRYNKAIWCHNYLGICHKELGQYEKSETHYKTALTGAQYFDIKVIFSSLYNNLSVLYYAKADYDEALTWAQKSIDTDGDRILPVCNYIKAYLKIGSPEELQALFKTYRVEGYMSSKYYPLLEFYYYSTYHFRDRIFYETVTNRVIPHFDKIGYSGVSLTIKMKLIEYLENNRKYKEALEIYKDLWASRYSG